MTPPADPPADAPANPPADPPAGPPGRPRSGPPAALPDPHDPKGLMREAYAMAGIGPAECRAVFLDWALSLAPGTDAGEALRALLARHGAAAPGHPMTALLRDGAGSAPGPAGRRGGRAGRAGRRIR